MRSTPLYSVFVFGASLFIQSTSAAQIVQRGGTTWVGLKPAEVFRLTRYEVKEEIEAVTRRDYIKRKIDKKWILFYTHERGIVATLGHAGHLVLINDNEASKSNKVVVVNLATNETKQIDTQAIEMYTRNASPDGRMVIIPEAHAFSPTDKEVLIEMELIYLSVPFEEKALTDRLSKSYKPWWYVVDSSTGNVRHVYRTNGLPKRWWIY
jgi:Pantoate-beta-alanine ligase